MNRSTSFLRTSFVSMPLLAGAVLATGCVDMTEPTTDTGEHAIVNQVGLSPVAPIGEVRVAGGRISLASPEWAQTDPGIWASSSRDGAGSIVIGAEGHRVAITKGKADLAALRASGGSTEAIEQQEAYLGSLEAATQLIASQPAVSLTVSCTIGFVIGASSPIIPGFVGAFAGAQLSCTGGTQVFTVQAQACTNFGCGPLATVTSTVGASPTTIGTARSGTAGAACFGTATVTPPGITGSASGPCG
jgi:hypothetical protein